MSSSCKHLRKYKPDIVRIYKDLCEHIVYPCSYDDFTRKASFVTCSECNSRLNAMLCCCLQCAYFACFEKGHLRSHLRQSSHQFGLSLETGNVYCLQCDDFVYDRECEYVRRDAENAHRKFVGFSLNFTWNPGKQEVNEIRRARKRILRVDSRTNYGLRGLVNLGNTCFMNCIIQALVHTPLLRDYFMTDQHRCVAESSMAEQCLMCETGRLYQQFYSGEKTPHIPFKMLHLVWTHARHLAGYEQQDAHEFFIAALDVLHRHSRSSAMAKNPHECQCIIDRIFTGKLQSDVTCTSCGGISTTVDPYWDISLDLGSTTASLFSADALLYSASETSSMTPISLANCLERFTRREHLGSTAKIKCARCETYQESTKQLTLRKLPIVACFHLKLHKKITTFISFPKYLDMTPYSTDYRNDLTTIIGESDEEEISSATQKLDRLRNKYALFAVVNHHGTMDGGHYTCYIRLQADNWYKCDDHIINETTIDDVLRSEGYLLFYHKQFLEYD